MFSTRPPARSATSGHHAVSPSPPRTATLPRHPRFARAPLALRVGAPLALLLSVLATSPAHAQGLGLPGPGGCFEDALEPNPYTNPTVLTASMERDDLNICTSDDWYRVDLEPGHVVRFELRLSHTSGDIDMTLHDEAYQRLAISESASNLERLAYVAHEPTTLLLRVYGYGGAANAYTLDYTLEDYSAGCATPADGHELRLGSVLSGPLCLGRTARWGLDAECGEPFEVTLMTSAATGDLDLAILGEDGRTVATSSSRGLWERVRVFPEDDERLEVVVTGYDGGFGNLEISAVALPEDPAPLELSGEVAYRRRVVGNRGLKEFADVRPVGVLVEVVRILDGFPVARTTTDAEGRYRFVLPHFAPEEHILRVSARLETAHHRLRIVRENGTDDVHHLDSAPLSEHPARDGRVTLDLWLEPDEPITGALNIAQVTRLAFETLAEVAPDHPLDLTIVWDQGQAHACGSCYSGGQILLAGGWRDTDEFDDVVILHELGHYFADQLSWDDSPGGRHDGSRTNPLIAFGEGYATAFALLVSGSPMYLDSSATGLRAYENLEEAPFLAAYGTADGQLGGPVSEWTTSALLWDLLDAHDEAEPHDRVSVSTLEMLRLMVHHLVDRRRPDVGARGLELADFIDTFRCTFREQTPALEQLVWGHQRYPIERVGKAKCEWSSPR